MAVRLEGSIKRYIGLSSDTKPVLGWQPDGSTLTGADLPAGSSFLETDTGRIYRWDGASAWTLPILGPDDQLYVLQALLSEVTQLRQIVEFYINL